jgi:hypothetical protein
MICVRLSLGRATQVVVTKEEIRVRFGRDDKGRG